MLIRRAADIRPSEITDEKVWRARRDFLRLGAAGALLLTSPARAGLFDSTPEPPPGRADFTGLNTTWGSELKANSWQEITTYNNFYELGTDKADPAQNAHYFTPQPWSVAIEGEVARPGRLGVEDLIARHPLEERIYRLRCVEGWSMVIPWVGFPLADLLKRFEPTANAKYVEFTTLHDPQRLPGQQRAVLPWPYVEGLRMDEAMHPLSLIAVGLYGRMLPAQNGAPLRLVVPWKYGFKSIKSIVRIRLTEQMPQTTWHRANAHEYGFYANVNPAVDHPRWSQARERRIGEFLKRDTLPFNGYGEQVASLYSGMDLTQWF